MRGRQTDVDTQRLPASHQTLYLSFNNGFVCTLSTLIALFAVWINTYWIDLDLFIIFFFTWW